MSAREKIDGWRRKLASVGWLGHALFWATVALIALIVLRLLTGSYFRTINILGNLDLVLVTLLACCVIFQLITRKLLWRVRNRLFVTYLLLGLAPIILFGVLILAAGYLFAGQYATNTALRSLDTEAEEVRSESGALAMLSVMNAVPTQAPVFNRGQQQPVTVADVALATRDGNVWRDLNKSKNRKTPMGPFDGQTSPAWLNAGFQGTVDFDGHLYLCSESEVAMGGRAGFVLASMPLNSKTVERMAKDLGVIYLLPGKLDDSHPHSRTFSTKQADKEEHASDSNVDVDADGIVADMESDRFHLIRAGTLPAPRHFGDLQVYFSAPFLVKNWNTGDEENSMLFVKSRPSLLYARLFATSTQVGAYVRYALLIASGVVLFTYLLAVLMAVGLSQTITRSIAALYRGTAEVEGGNLLYRVPVRGHDQLTALTTSFNTMSASMQDAMVQQREKERLESELSIAQEVQRNLFPVSPLHYGGLEVHAVCIPARVVSGDYYDFFAGQDQLCLALGDISGKGMSAALLMASLHAAVRSLGLSVEAAADGGEPSSARLFALLNRQIIESTQPERYATLFLTFYDHNRRALTYTNGGHLVPWLIAADGTHRTLDRGGPVVGLLNGLVYQQTTVECSDGDLLVVFSDGITEAENNAEEFGERRLLDFVHANRSLPLPELVTAALGLVRTWIGTTEQADDMTIMLARVGRQH